MQVPGLSRAIIDGELPIAVARFVERSDLAHHLVGPGAPIELALHLRPGSATAVADARAAAELVAARAREYDGVWNTWQAGARDDRFPFHAALMARDGSWHVAALEPRLAGQAVETAPLAAYALNNVADPVATRTADELRLVGHAGFGFSFGPDTVTAAARRVDQFPQRALGDTYRAPVVDAHLRTITERLGALDDALDALVPRRHGLELRPSVRAGDAGVSRVWAERTAAYDRLTDTLTELARPMPDEVTTANPDRALRAAVDMHRAALQRVHDDLSATFILARDHMDGPDPEQWRPIVARVRAALEALPAAPRPADQEPLAAFGTLVERLRGSSWDARHAAMQSFRYEEFGRTPGERIRNFAVAYEALEAGVGLGDRGVYRLKSWLRSVAADAATLRRELPADQEPVLGPILDAAHDHAARNGAEGIVFNARGVPGYEDFPDFAEVGRMSASLRTYLAIDDATGVARAAAAEPIAPGTISW